MNPPAEKSARPRAQQRGQDEQRHEPIEREPDQQRRQRDQRRRGDDTGIVVRFSHRGISRTCGWTPRSQLLRPSSGDHTKAGRNAPGLLVSLPLRGMGLGAGIRSY